MNSTPGTRQFAVKLRPYAGLRLFTGLIFLVLAIVPLGCVEVEQTIEMTAQNRGEFTISAKIPEQVALALEQKPDGYGRFLDPATGSLYFKDKGVRIVNYRVFKQRQSMRGIRITGEILDWKKVVASGCLGPFSLKESKGNQRLSLNLSEATSTSDESLLKKAYSGLSMKLTIKTPTDIISTTGKQKGSSTVQWTFDADKDISFLKKAPPMVVEYK